MAAPRNMVYTILEFPEYLAMAGAIRHAIPKFLP